MTNSHSGEITIVTAVFGGISLATVLLRCFVRLRVIRAFGWDDSLMVVAMLLNIGFATCSILGAAKYGMGKRMEFFLFHAEYFPKALLCFWLGQLLYITLAVVVKTSITLMLLRITVHRVHVGILYTTMALNIVAGLIFFFITIFQCTPVDHFWNRMTQPSGKCIDIHIVIDIAYLCSAVAALTDFVIGILPGFIIWDLHMPRRNKIAAGGILSLGCIAAIAVVIRFPFLKNYASQEFPFETSNIAIFSNLEASLGVTAGSLATLRPMFRFFREVSQGSRGYSRSPGPFPTSTTVENDTTVQPTKLDQEDAQQLWPSGRDVEAYGLRTVVLGNGRVALANSSDEDVNPHPHTVMGSRDLGRMRKI